MSDHSIAEEFPGVPGRQLPRENNVDRRHVRHFSEGGIPEFFKPLILRKFFWSGTTDPDITR